MTTPSRTRRTARACSAACLAAALALPLGLPATAGARDAAAPAPGGGGIGDPYFPTYGNSGYDVQRYDLAVRYDPETDRLQGRARVTLQATRDLSDLHLDLVGLRVRSVRVDGVDARWSRHSGHELVVRPARPLARGRTVSVEVRYSGVPQPFTAPQLGTTAWLETPDGVLAVGEPEVAAHWFPVNDHPADKARYRITITVPKGVEAISNGLPRARTVSGRWATTTWEVRDPMASYLAFLAIGQFDVHRWRTAEGLPVLDAVDASIRGALRRRIDATFARQGEMLSALSQWFGPYPFETIGGVVDRIDVGFALENQTRPTYSPELWDVPQAPTLGDTVVAHELAHQWYGNSVALRRWRDIWLNEGFATYAEWLWTEREFGFTPQEQFTSLYGIPEDVGFWELEIGDPGPDRLFDGAVYVRGAMTLQALRREIGGRDFFAVLRAWARENRDGHGTTAGFTALAERISGRSLDRLFDAWLYTASKPPAPSGSALTATSPGRQAQVDAAVQAWRQGLERRLAHGRH